MNEVILGNGLKLTADSLSIFRLLIEDTIREYIGLRMSVPGVVMKTDSDRSFLIDLDPAGDWRVAPGYIINSDNEIVINTNGVRTATDRLVPVPGLVPGGLTGDNPLDFTAGIEQWIVISTSELTHSIDIGDITVTAGSNSVQGTETWFTKYVKVGQTITVSGSAFGNDGDYIIQSVGDDTHLHTVEDFVANESGLRFTVKGTYFEGYPPGGDKSLYSYNSFTFRTTTVTPVLADGEYVLAKCDYALGVWTATDLRSSNQFAISGLRTVELMDTIITLAKMANNSVDENKIINTTFGAGLEGGSGVKPKISDLGVVLAMMAAESVDHNKLKNTAFVGGALEGSGSGAIVNIKNLGVALAMMAAESVDENKIITGTGDGATIAGGSGTKLNVISQHKYSAYRSGTNFEIPHATLTTFILNAENYDIGNNYDIATGVFTVPRTGHYHFDMNLTFDTFTFAVDKYIYIYLYVNAVPVVQRRYYGNGSAFYWTAGFSLDVALTVADTVYSRIIQNTGSSIYILTSNYNSVFNGHLIL